MVRLGARNGGEFAGTGLFIELEELPIAPGGVEALLALHHHLRRHELSSVHAKVFAQPVILLEPATRVTFSGNLSLMAYSVKIPWMERNRRAAVLGQDR